MGRKRIRDKDLPPRCTRRRGKIYYQVKPGQEHRFEGYKLYPLGSDISSAFYKLAQLTEFDYCAATLANIFDRYAAEVIPGKSVATQIGNLELLKPLRAVFGQMRPIDVKSAHLYQYRDKRSKTAPVQANKELALLSHVFTKCIEWGVIERHPMVNKGVVRNKEKPRDRYVTNDELNLFLTHCPAVLKNYIRLKLMLGARKSAVLALTESDVLEDGLLVTESKVGKARIFLWTDELKLLVDQILNSRTKIRCEYLFCTSDGEPFFRGGEKPSAFNSMWRRAMQKTLANGLSESFTEHDLRAKVASDVDELRAVELLANDPKLNKRVYRRGIDRVLPEKYSTNAKI